ncbi:MAG: 4Fe-4S binding protein [Archaeoglobaceae archaeon]
MIKISKFEMNVAESLLRHAEALSEAVKQALKPDRVTIEYPRERRRYPESFRGFIVFSAEKCISCFRCAQICPANAIQMEAHARMYPSIDYAKCIFCHFCVESCPTGALQSSKIHDVAFKDMEDMTVSASNMVELPKIVREEKFTVDIDAEGGIWRFVRRKELDDLRLPAVLPKVRKMVSVCKEPESCLGCRMCVEVCPQKAITVERCEITVEGEVVGTGCVLRISREKCTGCGLCVRQCPMEVLALEVVE